MITKITIDDPRYPKNMRHIHRPPHALYVNGMFRDEDAMAVAIVGSRRASPYGIEMGDVLGFELASRGVTVVSGMARGVDSAAHRGALRAKGRTIAVLGSGHGHVYPPENIDLYEAIAATGAVVTEFDHDVSPLMWNFPQRNRIISGMSLGVVVVEAAPNSGALITADYAAEQGRDVFAVPGRASSVTSAGTNALIKDGAKLVTTVDDILEGLAVIECEPPPVPPEEKARADELAVREAEERIINALTGDERRLYMTLSDVPLYVDEIHARMACDGANVSKMILKLLIKHVIQELPGKRYVRSLPPGMI